jgi:uncharacterized RDD family membrane protein YckC
MAKEPTEYESASVLQRVSAHCIDWFVVTLFVGVFASIIPPRGVLSVVLGLLLFGLALGYRILGDGFFQGAALGKRLSRIRVVDAATRQPCSIGQSAIRCGVFLIPFVPLIELVFLFIEGRQRWGDQLAKTYVLRRDPLVPQEVSRPLRPIDYTRIRDTIRDQRE